MAIKAVKGGQKATFTEQVWKNMPSHKYGWKIESEVPEEVQEMLSESGEAEAETTEEATEEKKTRRTKKA